MCHISAIDRLMQNEPNSFCSPVTSPLFWPRWNGTRRSISAAKKHFAVRRRPPGIYMVQIYFCTINPCWLATSSLLLGLALVWLVWPGRARAALRNRHHTWGCRPSWPGAGGAYMLNGCVYGEQHDDARWTLFSDAIMQLNQTIKGDRGS